MNDLLPPFPPTMPELIRFYVDKFGSADQIFDGPNPATFSEINERSADLARGLVAQGVGKSTRVGILMQNGSNWITAWQAINRIGAIAVMISTFSKPRELQHIIRHGDVDTLLASDRFLKHDYLERLEEALPSLSRQSGDRPLRLSETPFLRSIWVWSDDQKPKWAAGRVSELMQAGDAGHVDQDFLVAMENEVHPADDAIMIYTSGTTADPKAIVHTQGTMVKKGYAIAQYGMFEPGDRLVTTMPLFWVGGMVTSLFAANIKGAAMICPDSPATEDVIKAIREYGGTQISLWMEQFVQLLKSGDLGQEEFNGLKPISGMQQGIFGQIPTHLVANSLGMSETYASHTHEMPGPLPDDKAGSFGRPIPGVELKIIDPDTEEELPAGEIGELCVRGYCVMQGYYKREREDVFMPDGFFRTGDRCWICEDGYLFFDGRNDEMIKSRGVNIAPREVEAVMLQESDISEAYVMKAKDSNNLDIAVAVVVPMSDKTIDENDLRSRLSNSLSDYKVPRRIFCIDRDKIPRTPTEKVRKVELLEFVNERLSQG